MARKHGWIKKITIRRWKCHDSKKNQQESVAGLQLNKWNDYLISCFDQWFNNTQHRMITNVVKTKKYKSSLRWMVLEMQNDNKITGSYTQVSELRRPNRSPWGHFFIEETTWDSNMRLHSLPTERRLCSQSLNNLRKVGFIPKTDLWSPGRSTKLGNSFRQPVYGYTARTKLGRYGWFMHNTNREYTMISHDCLFLWHFYHIQCQKGTIWFSQTFLTDKKMWLVRDIWF